MLAKSLNELAPFVGQNVPNARAVLSLLCDGRMQVMTIYDHFQNNTHANTEEAATAIKGLELTSFKKYGSHLVSILRKMTQMAVESGEDTYASMANDLSLAYILNGLSAFYSSRNLAESVLERAIKQEYPRLAYEAARTLMRCHIVTDFAKRKEYLEFSELAAKYEPLSTIQLRAETLSLNQLSYKQFKRGVNKEQYAFLKEAEEELRPYVGIIESLPFHLAYFSIACDTLLYKGKYQELRQKIEDAIVYLSSRPYDVKAHLGPYHAYKAFSCGMLGCFDEGEKYLDTGLELCISGSVNWFSSLMFGIQMFLRVPKIECAAALYARGKRHKKFINLNNSMTERWHIIGAYLYLLLTAQNQEIPKGMPNYTYYKFRNENTTYHADKNGLFTTQLIAEVLLALKENRLDQVVDRLEALEKYRERYLLEEGTPRTAQLLKIVIYLARKGFQKSLYREKLSVYRAELENLPHQGLEFELIPYEQLIDLMEKMIEVGRQRGV